MISLADLHPKRQSTYVGHTNLRLLLHISFVSRGFLPVNLHLNLHASILNFFLYHFISMKRMGGAMYTLCVGYTQFRQCDFIITYFYDMIKND